MNRVVAIGTFDGVHRGHSAILCEAAAIAKKNGWQSMALTFSAPPRLFFRPEKNPYLLTTVDEKEYLFKQQGIDSSRVLRFGGSIASMSANDFFEKILIRQLSAGAVVVGYNFRFGKDREGTPEYLTRIAKSRGIAVHVVPEIRKGDGKISSGRIRAMLGEGKIREAGKLLGHPYVLIGTVIRGDGRGKTLGFPTANLMTDPMKIIPRGVFAVRCEILGAKTQPRHMGMCNVGVRPTFGGDFLLPSVEVHLLSFSGNLYGKKLKIEFIRKLRSEKKFVSVRAFIKQLERDQKAALQSLH